MSRESLYKARSLQVIKQYQLGPNYGESLYNLATYGVTRPLMA